MSYSSTFTYDSATSLTFDPTIVEVASGTVRLKDLGGGTYSITNPVVTSQYQIMASALTSFTQSATTPANTSVQYQLVIDGQNYWHDPAQAKWVLATDGFAQSNSASDINANASTLFSDLALLVSQYIGLRVFLHTSDATARPVLTQNTVGYTWVNGNPAVISQCLLFGYLSDLLGQQPAFNALKPINFVVSSEASFMHGSRFVLPFTKTASFDSSGYVSISVIETTTPGIPLSFGFTYYDGNSIAFAKLFNAIVPNTPTCSINNLSSLQKVNFG